MKKKLDEKTIVKEEKKNAKSKETVTTTTPKKKQPSKVKKKNTKKGTKKEKLQEETNVQLTDVKQSDNVENKMNTNVFAPHKKQFDDTKEKRILILIAYCIFLCVLIGLMCSMYLCLIYSTMPLREKLGITKEDISALNNGATYSTQSVALVKSQIDDLNQKIDDEKKKQANYDNENAAKVALIKRRDELQNELKSLSTQISDASSKITSLKNKIAELDKLISNNK